MAIFRDVDEFYACVGGLLDKIKDDPALNGELADSGAVIRFRYVEPSAVITLDGREGVNAIFYGESELPAHVEMRMTADFAHHFWMGELNIVAEVLKGNIAYRGSLSSLKRLLPLIKPAMERYPEHLREIGCERLLQVD